MTRVSTLKSAAMAQAEPTAIPTSTVFKAQGTPSGRPAQVGKTAVSAIQTLRLLARTYYNYTFSLQNVVRITEKELHTVLFNHSDHLFRQLLNVFTRNQRSFNHINTFSFSVPCAQQSAFALPRQAHVRGGNPVHSVS